MKHPATMLGDYYRRNQLLETETIDCMEYTLKSILNEISKAVTYAAIFFVLGHETQFLLCYVSMVSIRLFVGGIHCQTYWGCFFSSLLLISVCTLTPSVVALNLNLLLALSLISILFPLLLSPVTPTFRIIKCDEQKRILKISSVVITTFWIACSWLFIKSYSHTACILLSIIITNYQLPIPFIKNKVFLRHAQSPISK